MAHKLWLIAMVSNEVELDQYGQAIMHAGLHESLKMAIALLFYWYCSNRNRLCRASIYFGLRVHSQARIYIGGLLG